MDQVIADGTSTLLTAVARHNSTEGDGESGSPSPSGELVAAAVEPLMYNTDDEQRALLSEVIAHNEALPIEASAAADGAGASTSELPSMMSLV